MIYILDRVPSPLTWPLTTSSPSRFGIGFCVWDDDG